MTEPSDISVRIGPDNLFADLGHADPDGHLLKAKLVSRIADVMVERKLTLRSFASTNRSPP